MIIRKNNTENKEEIIKDVQDGLIKLYTQQKGE